MLRILCVMLAMALPAMAQEQAAGKLPYPAYYSFLTNDFADVLTDAAEARINALLVDARESRDLEMAVVTIGSRDDYLPSADIAGFSKALFNGWGIGNKDRNDGILLLVAIDDRQVRIALGAGYPARQDGIAARIIQTQILPAFRDGRVADGIYNGTQAALSQLTIAAGAAQDTATPPPQAVTTEPPPLTRTPGLEGWLQRQTEWVGKNPLLDVILLALVAVGGFFGLRAVRQYRPRKCPECGRVMLRLGDAQEDQYLDHGQIVEERLKSKNYGVWFCPRDEHVTVIGYPSLFKRRKACRDCGYHTLETQRTVITPATTTSHGQAQLSHICKGCDASYTEYKTIPMRPPKSRSSSSFGGGSSSSSGGFGGGGSSGGGSSGSW